MLRVLNAKERREAEERSTEERAAEDDNDDKDDDNNDEGGGPTGAPLEYYDDLDDWDGVGESATIILATAVWTMNLRLPPHREPLTATATMPEVEMEVGEINEDYTEVGEEEAL